MSKIHLSDSVETMFMKMSEGNPGALSVIMELLRSDSFHYIIMCDTLELYGEKLYMLYNDCCGRDIEKMKNVIDDWQHGKISKEEIHDHLSSAYGKPFDVPLPPLSNSKSERCCDNCKHDQECVDNLGFPDCPLHDKPLRRDWPCGHWEQRTGGSK